VREYRVLVLPSKSEASSHPINITQTPGEISLTLSM
jgi:hypothetical protein